MKKLTLLLSTLFLLAGASPILAQSPEISDLEAEIMELNQTLKEKKAELEELKASQEGVYTIESNNSTFAFSNPRVHENLLLLDLDYTNDSKGALDVMSEIWMLTFTYEDESTINQLWFENFELPEVEGRSPLNYNTRIKSGVTVNLVIGLAKDSPYYYPYYSEMEAMMGEVMAEEEMSEEMTEVIEPTEEIIVDTDWLEEISTLFITVDGYSSPEGFSQRIEIPIN